jgi:hypothetical protein
MTHLRKCGGHYDYYPDRCEECNRYMDDCDGSGKEEEIPPNKGTDDPNQSKFGFFKDIKATIER